MSRTPADYPRLFFALGADSAVPRRPTTPDDATCAARAAVIDAVRKGAFAAAMLLLEATPGLLNEVLDDQQCWAIVDHPPFTTVYPEAAEALRSKREVRRAFEASLAAST